MSRGALNVLLLLLALALGAVAYLRPGHRGPAEGGGEHPPLTPLRAAALHHLAVYKDGKLQVELERRGGRWRLLRPVAAAADGFRAEQLARLAEAPSLARFPAAGKDLSRYGLDHPALEVALDGLRLQFGGTTPVGARRYVRLGEVIHLVEDSYYYDAAAEPLAFVDKALVPEGASLRALRLPGLALRRTPQGGWRLEPPRQGVGSDQLQALVQAWRDARAWSVRRPQGRRPAHPAEVRLELADGRSLRYLITARKPDLVLVRPDLGLAYHLDASQAAELLELGKAREGAGSARDGSVHEGRPLKEEGSGEGSRSGGRDSAGKRAAAGR